MESKNYSIVKRNRATCRKARKEKNVLNGIKTSDGKSLIRKSFL